MVKLRDIEPLTLEGIELAYRHARPTPKLDVKEWLLELPDAGARLHALYHLFDDDVLNEKRGAPEQQSALRIACEVIRSIMLLCRDREKSIEEMVEEMMSGASATAGP